jgi:hypothetical protein
MNNTYIGDTLTTGTTIGNAQSGYVYTTSGTSSPITWANLNGTTGSWGTITTDPNLQGRTLQVNGDADITGELTVQGVKLSDRLDKIDERLAILHPNFELEEKWDDLRALRNAYIELEAEIKEKEKMWKILKK